MGHGPCTFKEADVTRALRAARKAGQEVARAEIEKDGKIVLVFSPASGKSAGAERNEWDDVIGHAD